jgi:hypothetical protein
MILRVYPQKKRFGSNKRGATDECQLMGLPLRFQVVKRGNRWSAVERAILFAYLEPFGTWRHANHQMMGQKIRLKWLSTTMITATSQKSLFKIP